jgi:hypothetical protein
MTRITIPGFRESDAPPRCQLCDRRRALAGGRPPLRVCARCLLDVVPALLAEAVVAEARGRRRAEEAACLCFRRLAEGFWGALRLDDDCRLPLAWIDQVERRVLAALPHAGGESGGVEGHVGPRS